MVESSDQSKRVMHMTIVCDTNARVTLACLRSSREYASSALPASRLIWIQALVFAICQHTSRRGSSLGILKDVLVLIVSVGASLCCCAGFAHSALGNVHACIDVLLQRLVVLDVCMDVCSAEATSCPQVVGQYF